MDALTLTLSCALAVTPLSSCHSHHSPHPLKYASLAPWRAEIDAASRRFGMPTAWIEAVIRRESGGYATLNGQPTTSDKGAMGLMQIMPATYAELRPRYGLGPDPYAPHDNIVAGTAYLSELYRAYGYPYLFAAYNAGTRRLESYLSGAQALPQETQSYLNKLHVSVRLPSRSVSKDQLFIAKNTVPMPESDAETGTPNDHRLFVFRWDIPSQP